MLNPDSRCCPTCLLTHPSTLEAKLCRIGDLLQQLVDKGATKTTPRWTECGYKCELHSMGWDDYHAAMRHWESGEHSAMLAESLGKR